MRAEPEPSRFIEALTATSQKMIGVGVLVLTCSALFECVFGQAVILLDPVMTPALAGIMVWFRDWQALFALPFAACLVALGCAVHIFVRKSEGAHSAA